MGTSTGTAGAWIGRARLLAEHVPELGLGPFDQNRLAEVLAGQCPGLTSFAALRKVDWVAALEGNLPWDARQALEREAPERIQVPSGYRARLDYQAQGPPILAVRIQDMFGTTDTPTIARGRVQVLLHLLAPNMRPAAITQDLPHFWREVYPEVRKQLRGRYPKHAWPEDPLSAKPGPKRRR